VSVFFVHFFHLEKRGKKKGNLKTGPVNPSAGGGSDDEPAPPAAPYGAEAGLPWWMLEA